MTTPFSEEPTRTYGAVPAREDKLRTEHPRTHPIAYIALILSIISLILGAKALHDANDHGNNDLVHVGNQNCIVVHHDNAPAGLFCQTD